MKVSIIGATGLIGGYCLELLQRLPEIERIYSLTRRSKGVSSSKIEERIGSLDTMPILSQGLKVDAAICCLGTTIKQAGSQEAFAAVDWHLPILFARTMYERGCRHFYVVSSLGASSKSKNFYLQTKGRMEDDLQSIGFTSLSIYRPSLLLGDRAEKRFGEQLAARLYAWMEPAYPRWLEAYRPIPAKRVAECIVEGVLAGGRGVEIWDNARMLARVESPK